MNKASERLIQCGWATQSIDSNKGLGIRLTSQGSEGLEDLYAAIQSLDPSTLEQDHMGGIVLHAIARHQARGGI